MPHVCDHMSGVADATRQVRVTEHDQVWKASDRIILSRGK